MAAQPFAEATARQMPRPVIALSCPADEAQDRLLCKMLEQVLIRAAPGAVIRRLFPGEELPLQPGLLSVTLDMDCRSETRLSGHLEWQGIAHEVPHIGPELQMDVSGEGLSPAVFDQFSRALLAASPELSKTLQRLEIPRDTQPGHLELKQETPD